MCETSRMNEENTSVCTAGTLNNYRLRPMAFGGHCFYVRRCLPGTAADPEDPKLCAIDGLIIPPGMGNQTEWFECRAVGHRVGEKCGRVHAQKYRADILKKYRHDPKQGMRVATDRKHIPHSLVGKRLFIALPWPLVDERVKESPLADFEFFVEETLPLAFMVEDN